MIESTQQALDYADAGWCNAIESVRGSLRAYPDSGGDIEIMREVERIVDAARCEERERIEGIVLEVCVAMVNSTLGGEQEVVRRVCNPILRRIRGEAER